MSRIVDQEKIPAENGWSTVTSIAGIDVVTSDGEINDMSSEETMKLEDPPIFSDDTRRTVFGFKACRICLCNSIFVDLELGCHSLPQWFLVCISLYFSDLIYGLDTTVAADIQGAVVGTFRILDS
jgi:hypothetical protein